jgi:hypothetical protein
VRRLALIFFTFIIAVAPWLIHAKSSHGTWRLTEAAAWNLLYGHPRTARCLPGSTRDDVERDFCTGFAAIPPGTREFGLALLPGSPGDRLIRRFGSFRAAGPHVQEIMVRHIFARPSDYITDIMDSGKRWMQASDNWYLPQQNGRFVRDPAVTPLFMEVFGAPSEPSPSAAMIWCWRSLRIPPAWFCTAWLAVCAATLIRFKRASVIHLAVGGTILGTLVFAFGEPRYLAPIELLALFAVASDVARWRRFQRLRQRTAARSKTDAPVAQAAQRTHLCLTD